MSSPLVKVVPTGSSVTPYSPFFTTQDELNRVLMSGQSLADAFGLPAVSEARSYSLFEISPNTNAAVYESRVAPTVEMFGGIEHVGGATQYIVPNRGLWSAPRFIQDFQDPNYP